MFQTIVSLLTVGILWGATNPFIRLGTKGLEKIETGSRVKNIYYELKFITTRLNYWIPFLLNQLGSVLYVHTLQQTNISSAVPIANSLSFAFTAISGYFLNEKIPGRNIILGTICVLIGSTFMIYDRIRAVEAVEYNFLKD